MDTLALEHATWDITCDAYGNWATVGDATPLSDQTGPGMRLAQDVASRVRAWRDGEVYFDTTQGVRYQTILGAAPNLSLVQNAFSTEALKVPLCQTAIAEFSFTGGASRVLGGRLLVADVDGNNGVVTIT